jgi:hypothetical protein
MMVVVRRPGGVDAGIIILASKCPDIRELWSFNTYFTNSPIIVPTLYIYYSLTHTHSLTHSLTHPIIHPPMHQKHQR